MLKANKIKHFNCKNCYCKERISFKNNVIFCFGLIKKPNPPCDYYRFCIMKGKKCNINDIMKEELYSMLMGLSSILFKKRLEEINKDEQKNISG
jgi:hypothetical protein